MNKKDLAELKRRFSYERNNITCIRGCFVDGQGKIITQFTQYLHGVPQGEAEKYLAIFKKVLSGAQDQNLLSIDYAAEDVLTNESHKRLMLLRDTALKEDNPVDDLFDAVIEAVTQEGDQTSHLILIMHDGYDLPHRSKTGENTGEDSTSVFSYILCAVCPVKQSKDELAYDANSERFIDAEGRFAAGMPECGFLFPAFEERAANIYSAMFYTKDASKSHETFIRNVFGTYSPMSVTEQKEQFQTLLEETLEEECSCDVIQAIHEKVIEQIEQSKNDKENAEPPRVDKQQVREALKECHVSDEKQAVFEEKFNDTFGSNAALSAAGVTSAKQFEVRTSNVYIRVAPERSDLVRTQMIDGMPCIVIVAEDDVRVNGISVRIHEQQ